MVTLDIWYDQDPDNDYGDGDPAIVVRTVGELDALVDRVLAETNGNRCAAMIHVGISGNEGYPILEVGLGPERGFITYHAEDGGATRGDGNPDDVVEYVYMGSVSEIPADVEVPIEQVRHGLREFLATGSRPSTVRQ